MNEREQAFFELVRTYPSPHNGQPMVLQRKSNTEFKVFFQTNRGLSATPISYLFSFVTIGVFFEHIEACAAALGHKITSHVNLPNVDDMGVEGSELFCGTIVLGWGEKKPDSNVYDALKFRQTSRKKYSSGLSETEMEHLHTLTSKGQKLVVLDDAKAHQTIWLNQRAVFDDMFDDAVRTELSKWLRTSHDEKMTKKDGLSYDCMELSGGALSFILKHYKVLRWPVVSSLLKQYYLRTMKDNSTVGYMATPFMKEADGLEIGRTVMKLWLDLSKHGAYLHPFGTIVSNLQAHKDFAELVGLDDEQREKNYVTFIFRAGRSDPPVRSERLGIEHFIRG